MNIFKYSYNNVQDSAQMMRISRAGTELKQHQVQTTIGFMLCITTIIRSEIDKMKIHYKRTKQLHYEKIKHGQCERVKVIESK